MKFTQSIQLNNSELSEQQEVEIVDTVTGVSYEVDENGGFARIRSVGEAELVFGDRKDIRLATQKAQLRAKANIAKFLNERITTDEVIDEIEKTVTSNTNGNLTANRETISNHMEKIQNNAEAYLKGVIATKVDINKDEKYVQVEMGISKKTMMAADTINKGLKTDSTENQIINPSYSKDSNSGGREIKKSKNYNNF